MSDLAQLQQAVRNSQQGQQKLAGLQPKYDYAASLRDAPAPQINQHGNVSPLAVMAQMVNQSRGRAGVRDIGAEQDTLRMNVAGGESAVQNNALQLSMEKAARQATTAKEATQAHEKDMRARSDDSGVEYLLPDGKTRMQVGRDADGNPINDATGERITDMEGWTKVQRSYGGYGSRGKALTYNNIQDMTTDGNQINKVTAIAGDYQDWYSQPTGMPTGFIDSISTALTSNDIMDMVSETTDARQKEALQWWSRWKMDYELIKRHELFGATLTNNEMASWKEAVNMFRGMDGAQVRERMEKLHADLRNEYSNHIQTVYETRGMDHEKQAIERMFGRAGGTIGEDGTFGWAPPEQEGARVQFTEEDLAIVSTMPAADKAKFDQLNNENQKIYLESLRAQPR